MNSISRRDALVLPSYAIRQAGFACIALAATVLCWPAAASTAATAVDFGKASPTPAVRNVANWVAQSLDNGQASFVIIDKHDARLYVFDPQARLRGSSPILLGAAPGDDTVPGIGDRPLAQVLPHEKTTPAGRFVAEHGVNTKGEDIVWVDYDAAVSMHRVRPTVAAERRLQRLASSSPGDNRISFGCINVPKTFYELQLGPAMTSRQSVVYILPEHKSLQEVFGPGVIEVVAAPLGARGGTARKASRKTNS